MDEKETITTEEIRRFSRVMSMMSAAYGALADWLESRKVTEIPGSGTQTAKLGLRYLGGFTGTVLKSYSKSLLGEGEDGPPEIASDLLKVETATKAAAKPRHDKSLTPRSPGVGKQLAREAKKRGEAKE